MTTLLNIMNELSDKVQQTSFYNSTIHYVEPYLYKIEQENKLKADFMSLFRFPFKSDSMESLFRIVTFCIELDGKFYFGIQPLFLVSNPIFRLMPDNYFPIFIPLAEIRIEEREIEGHKQNVYAKLDLCNYHVLNMDYPSLLAYINEQYVDMSNPVYDALLDINKVMEDHYPPENDLLCRELMHLVCSDNHCVLTLDCKKIISDPFFREEYIEKFENAKKECTAIIQSVQ